MSFSKAMRRTSVALSAACAIAASTGAVFGAAVTMPTPTGNQTFDSGSFANAILAGPVGGFACFTAGTLSACTASSLITAIVGPDLTTGLTLGNGAEVTIGVSGAATGITIWEAGAIDADNDGDVADSRVSVHTAAGWTAEHVYDVGHIAPVLNDTRPSGFQTNMGTFAAADFGLASGTPIDAIRIRGCCSAAEHADILAVAVVPEPRSVALLLAGLGMLTTAIRRRAR